MNTVNHLPQGWEYKKMPEVVKWGSGGTPKATESLYYENGTIPWLIIGDLNDGIVKTSATKITKLGLENSSAKLIPCGTLLIAMYGSIGKLGITGFECCTNQAIAFAQKLNGVDTMYLFYYLMMIKPKLVQMGKGGTQKNISQTVLNSLYIPLPPLPTQHAIVTRIETLFAELDKAVQHLRTAQQKLKTYRQAVLNHWLTNGSEKWQHTTIGNIVEKVEYGSSAKSEKEGRIPVLRMGNIQKGRFDWSDLVYSNNDEEINKYLLKKDDVLFNRTNSPELVGKTAIYKGERPAIFAGYLIRLHYKKDLINADFLNYFLNSDIARNYGNTVKSDGVNQSNINGQKLKTYPIALPPLTEQHRIVQEIESRLSQATATETYIENALQQAEALRQSILKKAFSGELV